MIRSKYAVWNFWDSNHHFEYSWDIYKKTSYFSHEMVLLYSFVFFVEVLSRYRGVLVSVHEKEDAYSSEQQ